MPVLGAGIHALSFHGRQKGVDGRTKSGQDGRQLNDLSNRD
jgi:hypothetical protein